MRLPPADTATPPMEGVFKPLVAEPRPFSAVQDFLAPLVSGWQERVQAANTSREMLRLHQRISAANPGLSGPDLYREIVRARHGSDAAGADEVLQHARDSFATWPVERALTFRDVVNYVAIADYLAAHESALWTQRNLGYYVGAWIPSEL